MVAALASSCKKDDEENSGGGGSTSAAYTVTAQVENGNSYNAQIDSVKMLIYKYVEETGEIELVSTIASAAYHNGGFTLKLPATVSNAYLSELGAVGLGAGLDGITISNPSVKTTSGTAIVAYKSGEQAGNFIYSAATLFVGQGQYVYANGDVSLTGSVTDSDTYGMAMKYNVQLKKGWNMVYTKLNMNSMEFEMTTQEPSGLKWRYYPGGMKGDLDIKKGLKLPKWNYPMYQL
jgi:hypothetical protein